MSKPKNSVWVILILVFFAIPVSGRSLQDQQNNRYTLVFRNQLWGQGGYNNMDLKKELRRQFPELRGKLRHLHIKQAILLASATKKNDKIILKVGPSQQRRYYLKKNGKKFRANSYRLIIAPNNIHSKKTWILTFEGQFKVNRIAVEFKERDVDAFSDHQESVRQDDYRRKRKNRYRNDDHYYDNREDDYYPPTSQSHDPIGFIDHAAYHLGAVAGWALDKDTPFEPIEILVYIDAPGGRGGRLIASGYADRPRPDINRAHRVGGDHGYHIPLNQRYRGRRVFVHAVDSHDQTIDTLLTNSGIIFD